jgi:hypothetical protein
MFWKYQIVISGAVICTNYLGLGIAFRGLTLVAFQAILNFDRA